MRTKLADTLDYFEDENIRKYAVYKAGRFIRSTIENMSLLDKDDGCKLFIEMFIDKGAEVRVNGEKLIGKELSDKFYDGVHKTNMDRYIVDIGDGGSKADKFERDIKLLTQGIKDEPDNSRYYFYLANSYHDSGKNDEAIEFYKIHSQEHFRPG